MMLVRKTTPPATSDPRVPRTWPHSTARQGRSGLGIEAQRAAVIRFAEVEGFELTAEFVEAESGKGADALDRRPELASALAAGRADKCPVIVAKLDRLSRDVAFIAGLMAQRVPFIVAELVIQGDRQVTTTNAEIADAQWPGPPRSGDRCVIDGRTTTIQSCDTGRLRNEIVLHLIQVRG